MAFLSNSKLKALGFKSLGKNVLLSDKASIYGCEHIEIGDNTRIDDFTIISASEKGILIGKHVHIANHCSVIGKEKIIFKDFSGISSRVAIYSSSDDYSGEYMTNPTVDSSLTNIRSKPVLIGKHVIIGCGSVILPGVTLEDGSAVGSLALVSKKCLGGYIYTGNPAKKTIKRKENIFQLEKMHFQEREKIYDH